VAELTRRDKLRRLGITLLVLACIAGAGVAVANTQEVDSNGDAVVDSGNPCDVDVSGDVEEVPTCDPDAAEVQADAIEQLFPADGAEVLQQVQAGVDLGNRYTGTLVVNGIEVPDEQLTRQRELNQVFFSPGDDQVLEEWAPGENCIRAIYWPIAEGRSESRDIRWCFRVT
jgi:hypothetical protein